MYGQYSKCLLPKLLINLYLFRFTCNKGFFSKGNSLTVCQSNQSFNFTYGSFECLPIACDVPPVVKYGTSNLHMRTNNKVFIFQFKNLNTFKNYTRKHILL